MRRLMRYSLLAVSLAGAAIPVQGKAPREEELELTVCVMNDAGVSLAVVEDVERRVVSLMQGASIQIRWLHGLEPGRTPEVRCRCSHPEPMRVLILHLLATGRAALPSELGQAFLGEDGQGVMADVFLDRLEQLTEERAIDYGRLLAHVAAHELGHLLLGPNAHSVVGLMQAKMTADSLERMEQGNFRFSQEQLRKMHARLKAAEQTAGWQRSGEGCSENGMTKSRLTQAEAM